MARLFNLLIIFAATIAAVSTAFSSDDFVKFFSDGIHLVHFERAKDGSAAYDFWYKTKDGKNFRGKTYSLLNNDKVENPDGHLHIYLLAGADDVLYWVKFTRDEFENMKSLSKMVRRVNRVNNALKLKDDFTEYTVEYSIELSAAAVHSLPYLTIWDLERICFKRRGQTFNYTIRAINNSRKFNGSTSVEDNDPNVQLIIHNDRPQRDAIYRVEFTDDELNSDRVFCRGITKTLKDFTVLGTDTFINVDQKVLKTLVG